MEVAIVLYDLRKMNEQKTMMALYKATWIVILVAIYLIGKEGDFSSVLFAAIICMVIATFSAMHLAAKESIGIGYAKRNLTLAVAFTFIGGLGFVIWPILVNSEIEKSRIGPSPSTANGPNEA